MDFEAVLSLAQKNKGQKQPTACYQTKYTPPKKQSKQAKTLSENIKKFLARKEEEERQKALEDRKKKENLLSLRDQKTQNRINKHLKVCKSANKSVLADAIDNENTSITIAGPSQPDEDDYGYVSQEASALYDQFMNKYNKLPPEKPIFTSFEKREIKDIASTKDRLKQIFKQEALSATEGHSRKRKLSSLNVKEAEDHEKVEKNVINKIKEENKDDKPKAKKKACPPPMDFAELLKLAEKKQHEPVIIEVKPKVEERPMTKRQLEEYTREKERKEQREKNLETNRKSNSITVPLQSKSIKIQSNKIVSKTSEKTPISNTIQKIPQKISPILPKKITDKTNDKHDIEKPPSKNLVKNELSEERKKLEAEKKQLEKIRRDIEEEKRKLAQIRNRQEDIKAEIKSSNNNKVINKSNIASKQVLSKDIKPRQFPPADLKPNSLLANNKPKFPSSDVGPIKPKEMIKKPALKKRRIYDDDDEDDSDMNDFIDDGQEEDTEDYSRYISEIFGYDKSKFIKDDTDDTAMESTFEQQLKEEYISTKIGIMEDLEDMRNEALEKQRKAHLKKKIKK